MSGDNVRTSKFLSYVLRHNPAAIGLELDTGGWASVEELIKCAAAAGHRLSVETLREIVATNHKQRFRLSDDGTKIRANQGHSFEVDLGLEPVLPPSQLYHGTATHFLTSILEKGLLPSGRQYVHLSLEKQTALTVGRRHGTPAVLAVAAGRMHADGHTFLRAENGVWLTEQVPPGYLQLLQDVL